MTEVCVSVYVGAGLRMHPFDEQSETIMVTVPELNVARTGVLVSRCFTIGIIHDTACCTALLLCDHPLDGHDHHHHPKCRPA